MNPDKEREVPECPVCGESLARVTFRDVEIDLCYKCRGVWLDSGELEQLLKDASNASPLLNSRKPFHRSREKARSCPRCGVEMKKMTVGIDNPVVIDSCPRGHGEWYDRGELLSMLRQSGLDLSNLLVQLMERILARNSEEE